MGDLLGSDLELVSCNLCGGDRTQPFCQSKGMQVVQCLECGLVFVNPRPGENALHRQYNEGQSSRIQYYLDVECGSTHLRRSSRPG